MEPPLKWPKCKDLYWTVVRNQPLQYPLSLVLNQLSMMLPGDSKSTSIIETTLKDQAQNHGNPLKKFCCDRNVTLLSLSILRQVLSNASSNPDYMSAVEALPRAQFCQCFVSIFTQVRATVCQTFDIHVHVVVFSSSCKAV